jgi:hypothetical protein
MTIRAWNIALRTAHIGAMGVLLGGHAFDVAPERLMVSLWLTIGTGVALGALEVGTQLTWFHQGRGLMTMTKLALLCVVPLAWDYRLPILLAVIVLGSIGSHMPARFRYYSVLQRRVLPNTCGPGAKRTQDDTLEIQ